MNLFLRSQNATSALGVRRKVPDFFPFSMPFSISVNGYNTLEQPQINLLQKLVNPRNTWISRKDLGIGHYLMALTLVSSILIPCRPTTNPRNSTVSVSKTHFLRFAQSQCRSSLSRTYKTASVQASGSSEKINISSKQTTQLILTSPTSA